MPVSFSQKVRELKQAAQDSMVDDFPTTRHDGAEKFKKLCTPAFVLQMIDALESSENTDLG